MKKRKKKFLFISERSNERGKACQIKKKAGSAYPPVNCAACLPPDTSLMDSLKNPSL